MFLREQLDLFSEIIGHEEIVLRFRHGSEKFFVVYFCIPIEAPPCDGIRRVDEENGVFLIAKFSNDVDSVSLNKRDVFPFLYDLKYSAL